MKQLYSFITLCILLLCVSCKGKQRGKSSLVGDTLHFEYAKNIEIIKFKNFTLVNLKNPWNTQKILAQYVLSSSKKVLNTHAYPYATKVLVPLKRTIVFTTTHCWLLNEFKQSDKIAGVCDLPYIHVPEIVKGVKQKTIVDCGNSFYPNIEKMAILNPDALFFSPFEDNRKQTKLQKMGIPLIACAEYMERHPLARAEWMCFYGMLYGCEKQSSELFNKVKLNYLNLALKAKKQHNNPSILLEKPYENIWYMPAGGSTIAQMMHDAGAKYYGLHFDKSGSLPFSIEQVLTKMASSDVWTFTYNAPEKMRLKDVLAQVKGAELIRAFKQKRVFGCNAQLKPFYEETPFRPDLLLKDFIDILHFSENKFIRLRYYEQLEP